MVVDVPFGAIYSKKVALKNCIEIYKKNRLRRSKDRRRIRDKGYRKSSKPKRSRRYGTYRAKTATLKKRGRF
ncbi:hypothetical protein [Campylobacter hyointestinalis]|uniref:hypothetical protein n=1 Tax=Campylobacter hyointestinalis TaxID=198 RepID=UPI002162E661|nr:hypothetical protein [Campylobacter hyointestinalis]